MSKFRNTNEPPKEQKGHRINEAIRVREVFLIDENEEKLGVVVTKEAMKTAKEKGLDLVEVASKAKPPVCKLMDYGKFLYHEKKKKKHQELQNRHQEDREIRVRPDTDEHDLEIKSKKAREFLKSGCKVKIQIKLRGRERSMRGIQDNTANRFASYLEDISRLEKRGNTFILIPT